MVSKTFRKNKKFQKGGWYENTFNNFKEDAIQENDVLKQTSEWWNELKEELNFYATEMSYEFMQQPRFQNMPMDVVQEELDILNLLVLDLALEFSKIYNQHGHNAYVPSHKFIETFNKRSLQLKKINNIDFVEFIQILLRHVKSTKYYGEINVLE